MIQKNNGLLKNARSLRKNMTRHERHLWYDFLQKYPLKIYKQRIIGNYIVDFYCHSAKLAIELDGSQHYEEDAVRHDDNRTAFLKSQGIEVLRILNTEIDKSFEAVCTMIDQAIRKRTNTDPL